MKRYAIIFAAFVAFAAAFRPAAHPQPAPAAIVHPARATSQSVKEIDAAEQYNVWELQQGALGMN
ncbi:MAG TPA: hypothetical protein VFW23_06955 [Tepidisphaeraceae bacterium]|nr:hypothetical protein [Tepidisphaeraceae bacterium]